MNKKLVLARTNADFTQKELASKVGIGERTYQAYEAEGRVPNVSTAILIASVLGVDVKDIFTVKSYHEKTG